MFTITRMKFSIVFSAFLLGAALGALSMVVFFRPSASSVPDAMNDGNAIDRLREGVSQPVDLTSARYTNTTYGFSLLYPIDLVKKEFNEGSGAMTVVFQKPNEQQGFQIFIVPYTEKQIQQSRIKEDLHGAPMNNVTTIVLPGNIQAVHFESEAPIIGASTEVWFIHNGYLFEVTAYHALDSWLASILATLQFTK